MGEKKLTHIAFIMDGNGRWAKKKGLARLEGHREGAQRAWDIALESFESWKVSFVTLYAFSTENWTRPKSEIEGLFALLKSFLKKEQERFVAHQIRLRTIGDLTRLPSGLQKIITEVQEKTVQFKRNLVIALNYGSRDEVLRAFNRYLKTGEREQPLTWEIFARFLDTVDIPDPDLIVRTSGECRLSNYLLLQAAYSELYFTATPWPDFNEEELKKAMNNYFSRDRRFGTIDQQPV